MKNKVRFISILLFTFFSLTGCSQTKTKVNTTLTNFDGTIINNQQNVEGTAILDDSNGTLISGNGSFNLQKKAHLKINSKLTVLHNKQLFFGDGQVEFSSESVEKVNVKWFGATPDDKTSDVVAIQKAIDAAIMSKGVAVVYFPPGEYIIDKPLLALRKRKDGFTFFNLTLKGHQLPYNNPGGNKGGVSVIKVNKEIPFALGIQGARGVHIENMVFDGYFKQKTAIKDLIYKPSNSIYKQERFTPLAAIIIDPFGNKPPEGGGYEGFQSYYNNASSSSRIHIEGSVIQNFPTGIAISPNGETKQGDSVAITYTRFFNLVHGIVMCQAQSRNVVVDNCSFHRMKFAFNSEDFGEQQGILPEVTNIKVADGVAWLYKANGNIAYGHFRNVYAESLYGIGYSVINKQPMDFHGCVFKFRPVTDKNKNEVNSAIIKADNASFTGCTFTYGGGKDNIEPLVMDVKKVTFINCYFDSYPVNIGEDINNRNVSNFISNGLRKNKLESTSWNEKKFNKTQKTEIVYNEKTELFSFGKTQGYGKGDFVFGLLKMDGEPFRGESIYTVLGQVEKVNGNIVSFKSEKLSKDTHSMLIIKR